MLEGKFYISKINDKNDVKEELDAMWNDEEKIMQFSKKLYEYFNAKFENLKFYPGTDWSINQGYDLWSATGNDIQREFKFMEIAHVEKDKQETITVEGLWCKDEDDRLALDDNTHVKLTYQLEEKHVSELAKDICSPDFRNKLGISFSTPALLQEFLNSHTKQPVKIVIDKNRNTKNNVRK